MKYEDFEKEFINILKIVAENPEKFDSDEFTQLDELMMINNRSYECWMHPGHPGSFKKGSSMFMLTLKKKRFSYTYCHYLRENHKEMFPHADPKRCKIIDTPREIYDNYPDPEKLISIMNRWVVERI